MGNPEDKPEEPQVQEESNYTFPPATAAPKLTQNRLTGDVWMGFNPVRMTRRMALAWAALQIENVYAQMDAQVEAAHQAQVADQNIKNGRMGIKDILKMPFRRG